MRKPPEFQLQPPAARASVRQGTAFQPVEDQCVVYEQMIVGQEPVALHRAGDGGTQQSILQPPDWRWLGLLEPDLMLLARHAGVDRPAEGWMEAERSRHRYVAFVGNCRAHRQGRT